MNAIDFLIKEHEHVKKTLAEISDPSQHEEARRDQFEHLCNELIRHETMEHQVWYPYFKDDTRLKEEVRHLLSEEKAAEKAIEQFDHIHSQQEWELQFSKFKKAVEHHAYEEEHTLFPEVKKLFSDEELENIGLQLYHFKEDYESSH